MKLDELIEYIGVRLPFSAGFQHIQALKQELKGCQTVLDVGCGRGPFKIFSEYESTGVDVYPDALIRAQANGYYHKLMKCDARELPFKDKSFDVVTCMQLIEHISKDEGKALIAKLERIARKKVVIMTPWGFYRIADKENPYMSHLCGWLPEEFAQTGYRVRTFYALRMRFSDNPVIQVLDYFLSMLCRPLIYFWPQRFSNEFMAVKEL